MNDASGSRSPGLGAQDFLATVWPMACTEDSEWQRRKKLAIRSGHLAMAVLVMAAVSGAVVVGFSGLSVLHLAALVLVGLCYVFWNLLGTRGVVRLVLWEREEAPPFPLQMPRWQALTYFAAQLTLAGLVYYMGDLGNSPTLVWLALLPPVAYGVFLLERRGIVLISVLTLGVFALNVLRWHGWRGLPYGLLAFSFAMLFTLVFTLLAVSSR